MMATTNQRIDVGALRNGNAVLTAEPVQASLRQQIALRSIQTNGGTQMRAALNQETVDEYVEAMAKNGWGDFPPIVTYYDGSLHWVADGFHRLAAWSKVGVSVSDSLVPAIVHSGTRRDAILHAAGANAAHGLRRTNADKRRAVETVLRDEEWSQWSDAEIARRCAVDPKTVGAIRKELTATMEIPESTHRKGADGRVIDARNIGGKPVTYLSIDQIILALRPLLSNDTGAAIWECAAGRNQTMFVACQQALAPERVRQHELYMALYKLAEERGINLSGNAVNGDRPLPDWVHTDDANAASTLVPASPQGDSADLPTSPLDGVSDDDTEAEEDRPAPDAGDALEETLRTHFNAPLPTTSSDPWLTAAVAPVRRQERSALLADALQPWIREYQDEYGRDWKHLAEYGNPSHSNSTFWREIQKECQRRNVRIDDDTLKGAIKQAFAAMLAQHQAEAPITETEPAGVTGDASAPALPPIELPSHAGTAVAMEFSRAGRISANDLVQKYGYGFGFHPRPPYGDGMVDLSHHDRETKIHRRLGVFANDDEALAAARRDLQERIAAAVLPLEAQAAADPVEEEPAVQPTLPPVPDDLAAAGWELRCSEFGRYYLINERNARTTRSCAKVEQTFEIARGLMTGNWTPPAATPPAPLAATAPRRHPQHDELFDFLELCELTVREMHKWAILTGLHVDILEAERGLRHLIGRTNAILKDFDHAAAAVDHG